MNTQDTMLFSLSLSLLFASSNLVASEMDTWKEDYGKSKFKLECPAITNHYNSTIQGKGFFYLEDNTGKQVNLILYRDSNKVSATFNVPHVADFNSSHHYGFSNSKFIILLSKSNDEIQLIDKNDSENKLYFKECRTPMPQPNICSFRTLNDGTYQLYIDDQMFGLPVDFSDLNWAKKSASFMAIGNCADGWSYRYKP